MKFICKIFGHNYPTTIKVNNKSRTQDSRICCRCGFFNEDSKIGYVKVENINNSKGNIVEITAVGGSGGGGSGGSGKLSGSGEIFSENEKFKSGAGGSCKKDEFVSIQMDKEA